MASITSNGYIHQVSPIKTVSTSETKYFDIEAQTLDDNAVRVVCFSPEKLVDLQQCQINQTPVCITEAPRNEKKALFI